MDSNRKFATLAFQSTLRRMLLLSIPGIALTGGLAAHALAQDAAQEQPGPPPAVYRFEVPLPISGKSLVRRVEQVLRKLPADGLRPVFIFEFRPLNDAAAESTSFGDALDLARFLSGDALSRVRTVAWAPLTVKGHSVLPVLACEQIVIAKAAELGAAGIREKTIDETLRRAYAEIAERRRCVPAAVALGLLDKDLTVTKVTIDKKVRYETPEGLAKLREQAGAIDEESVFFQPGEQHLLTGQQMRVAPGFLVLLADDRRALASALQLPLHALQQDLAPEDGWKPVHVNLSGPVHRQTVNWILRSLGSQQQRGNFNLVVLSINSAGGDLEQSRRLAEFLANLDSDIHTVAFVDRQARSDASLIALACHELVMRPEAVLGGPGEAAHTKRELSAIGPALPEIFARLGRDWSLPLALIDSSVKVQGYRHPVSGEVRYLCDEELRSLENAADWQVHGDALALDRGLAGSEAEKLGLVSSTAESFDQFKAHYHLAGELAEVRPNWALTLVEWLADPRIAGVLLFVGWFALMFEMSSPGVGVPGFIAITCFLLYFWSQFLHGTAGWLEVLLFVAGLGCLCVEIFLLPGMGIFGVGGALMVVASIVLASQTFVLPTNAYQLRQFPISLLMVAAGMAGGVASLYVIRRFLPDTPYFNRMLLSPLPPEERAALSRRESLAAWDHLLHKRGVAMTPLVPAGKVQFGDDLVDCISNGELVAKGTSVVVEEVAGSRVVVRRMNS